MKKVRVGLILGPADDQGAGTANYARHLVAHMYERRVHDDLEFEFHLIAPDASDFERFESSSARTLVVPNPFRAVSKSYLWYPWLPRALKRFELDVVHNLYGRATFFGFKQHYVITVHDFSPLVIPEHVPKANVVISKLFLRRSLLNADRVVVPSEFTKDDAVRLFPDLNAEKLEVIPMGIPRDYGTIDTSLSDSIRRKYALDFPFILFVGTIEPRKNIEALMAAFVSVSKSHPSHKLVLAGKKGSRADRILSRARTLGCSDSLLHLNDVPDDDLRHLYRLADVLVHPSLYEGFGFPPLEAMALGMPVVASDTTCLPEILEDAALLCDARDPASIAAAIARMLSDSNLRKSYIERGLRHVVKFRWEETAARTLDLYRRLLY